MRNAPIDRKLPQQITQPSLRQVHGDVIWRDIKQMHVRMMTRRTRFALNIPNIRERSRVKINMAEGC